jgi:hypothetical protein
LKRFAAVYLSQFRKPEVVDLRRNICPLQRSRPKELTLPVTVGLQRASLLINKKGGRIVSYRSALKNSGFFKSMAIWRKKKESLGIK